MQAGRLDRLRGSAVVVLFQMFREEAKAAKSAKLSFLRFLRPFAGNRSCGFVPERTITGRAGELRFNWFDRAFDGKVCPDEK
jgi:hypothetical protein